MFCLGWRNFDDEHVSSLPHDKELVRSDAYVLFYRHRNLSVDQLVNEQTSSPISMDTTNEDTVIMESSHMKETVIMEPSHMKDVYDFLN